MSSRSWLAGLIVLAFMAACSLRPGSTRPLAAATPIPPTQNTSQSNNQVTCDIKSFRENSARFRRLTIDDGLSQSSVNSILQDRKGFLWFATQDGLNRYDGYEFKIFKPEEDQENSLGSRYICSLVEDSSGALWLGTDTSGVDHLDPDQGEFQHYRYVEGNPNSLSNGQVHEVMVDHQGIVWAATSNGLNQIDPQKNQITRYRHDPQNPGSLASDHLSTVYEDRQGIIWVGTDQGLDRFDQQSGQFVHYKYDPQVATSIAKGEVTIIYEDRSGILWVGVSGEGLDRFDRQRGIFTHYRNDPQKPESLANDQVEQVYEDSQGCLWVGTYGGGLELMDRQSGTFIHFQNDPGNPASLSDDYVLSIGEDQSGVLWIGTAGNGVNLLERNAPRFVLYQVEGGKQGNQARGLSNNVVWSAYLDSQNNLWVGTNGGGLNRLDRSTGEWQYYQHDPADPESLSSDVVLSILEGSLQPGTPSQAGLWVGTYAGLDWLDPKTGRFQRFNHDPEDPNSLVDNLITRLYLDRKSQLWVGTSKGLDRYDPGSRKFIHNIPSDGGELPLVRDIYESHDGTLWLATAYGLVSLEASNGKSVRYLNSKGDSNSLSFNVVMSIFEDRQGILWLGTAGGGLNRFDPSTKTFSHFGEPEGMPNEVVYGVLGDPQGYLWLSTNNGLARFDPVTKVVKVYDANDGLQSREFDSGAYFQGSQGEMFFGGVRGLNAFFPNEIGKGNPYIPPVMLTSLTQNGVPFTVGHSPETAQEITLRWPNNDFEFEFVALSYIRPEKNQYAYQLQNFDEDWNYSGNRRFGSYTNLPGGNYILHLKGSNNDQLWNEQGISLRIHVIPPFWETWWFRGVILLALVTGTYGGYRLRVKGVEDRNRELETQVVERTHEIEQRRQELEALYRAEEELFRNMGVDQVLQALVDTAIRLLGADKGTVMTWDESHNRLVARAVRGFSPETAAKLVFKPGEGVVGWVATTGEPAIVNDSRGDPRVRREITEPEGIRSLMQVPIKVGGEIFGVFSADYTHFHQISKEELNLLVALAERAASAIQNAQVYEQTQETAVVEERSRLARELHDAVTQTLFSASLIAEALPSSWENDSQEGQRLLSELRQLNRGALAEMRTLLLELRPAALIESNMEDLLHQLAEAATGREGIPVEVKIKGRCALPSDVQIAFFRIAQEALNNVVKHARASQVTVELECVNHGSSQPDSRTCDSVRLSVVDNGRGFELEKGRPDHMGLGIMRERAQAVGAELTITSQPGKGTSVVVLWEQNNNGKITEEAT